MIIRRAENKDKEKIKDLLKQVNRTSKNGQ